MCGRYYRRSDKQRIAECFAANPAPDLTDVVPDYNVAPTTFQPVIRNSRDGAVRELLLMRWGLVPFFAKSPADFKGFSTFNAKAETVTTQATWREPFKRGRRCLVPADGYPASASGQRPSLASFYRRPAGRGSRPGSGSACCAGNRRARVLAKSTPRRERSSRRRASLPRLCRRSRRRGCHLRHDCRAPACAASHQAAVRRSRKRRARDRPSAGPEQIAARSYDQTGGVCIVLRSASLACGGASRRCTKAA